ncbi:MULTISPECIES: hypothetical protein [unclassified Sphingobium]|uniref:hypothetical protein n=1 Tax=unclassified Sphingobium TaxID=2611147 RepID=UPI002225352C|nr:MULTISPECIES: hypothetical protein [unclassified Sphingobium]MCW2412038.1 hypothetical protein [Sphingobium sp. B8D3D]MCW2415665.1 hypothetical protein [Sphingobium sp. B8D3A]
MMGQGGTVAEILPPEGATPFPQAQDPLLIDERGFGWVPHAFRPGFCAYTPITRGVGIAWWPIQEIGGAIISAYGGNPAQPTDESVVFSITREGLRGLIADLQSIADQLDQS